MPALCVPFADLPTVDLHVDAVYQGGPFKDVRSDPLQFLVPCGNQGGFRFSRDRRTSRYRIAVLYSSGADPDWPDTLDPQTGHLSYYGDNRAPGDLHATTRGGNRLLRSAFDAVHARDRSSVPPFLFFTKDGTGRDVRFRGLAAPGGRSVGQDDLVAVWRTSRGDRFQNYRATFTILDVSTVSRAWVNSLATDSSTLGLDAPAAWRTWVQRGAYQPLLAPRTIAYRTQAEQLPTSKADEAVVGALYRHFEHRPTDFEACADALWAMAEPRVTGSRVTRPSVDGGRDAVGLMAIGPHADPIALDFALEAKCFKPGNGVGVAGVARLISRLRHRQFGVLVTTSYLGRQAYEEIREDGHPVVVLSAVDIVGILKASGRTTASSVQVWLDLEFPPPA